MKEILPADFTGHGPERAERRFPDRQQSVTTDGLRSGLNFGAERERYAVSAVMEADRIQTKFLEVSFGEIAREIVIPHGLETIYLVLSDETIVEMRNSGSASCRSLRYNVYTNELPSEPGRSVDDQDFLIFNLSDPGMVRDSAVNFKFDESQLNHAFLSWLGRMRGRSLTCENSMIYRVGKVEVKADGNLSSVLFSGGGLLKTGFALALVAFVAYGGKNMIERVSISERVEWKDLPHEFSGIRFSGDPALYTDTALSFALWQTVRSLSRSERMALESIHLSSIGCEGVKRLPQPVHLAHEETTPVHKSYLVVTVGTIEDMVGSSLRYAIPSDGVKASGLSWLQRAISPDIERYLDARRVTQTLRLVLPPILLVLILAGGVYEAWKKMTFHAKSPSLRKQRDNGRALSCPDDDTSEESFGRRIDLS